MIPNTTPQPLDIGADMQAAIALGREARRRGEEEILPRGISTGPKPHTPATVRALLSGSEDEAITFIRRHAENESFLRQAEELEAARSPQRPSALKLIQTLRQTLTGRAIA